MVAGVALAAVSVLLSGCYDSAADLVGSHAVEVRRADALMILGNRAYYALQAGTVSLVCPQDRKPAIEKACEKPDEVKLERTFMGNYIVQVKRDGRYHFALWTRSADKAADRTGSSCFLWLGQGFVGDDPLREGYSVAFASSPAFRAIRDALPVKTASLAERDDLLRVAAVYEAQLQSHEYPCFGDVLWMSDAPSIAGDNRDRPAYVPGP